jgi:hypothetical protein
LGVVTLDRTKVKANASIAKSYTYKHLRQEEELEKETEEWAFKMLPKMLSAEAKPILKPRYPLAIALIISTIVFSIFAIMLLFGLI